MIFSLFGDTSSLISHSTFLIISLINNYSTIILVARVYTINNTKLFCSYGVFIQVENTIGKK